MKQITLSFTPEEYRELAKLVTLGSFLTMGADEYPDHELTEEVILTICTNGFVQLPETGAFAMMGQEVGAYREKEFGVSDGLHEECELLEQEHMKKNFLDYLACVMADRDFYEQHGQIDPDEIVKNPDFVQFILDKQTAYRQEFMFNGADNLRLIK